MGWGRALVAGGIVAGAGFALQQIGNAIFSATGTTAGPVVNYGALIGAASIALYGIGGLIAVYGLLKGGYSVVAGGDEEDGGGSEEGATRSGSRTAPSSQQDRPRNQRRS